MAESITKTRVSGGRRRLLPWLACLPALGTLIVFLFVVAAVNFTRAPARQVRRFEAAADLALVKGDYPLAALYSHRLVQLEPANVEYRERLKLAVSRR